MIALKPLFLLDQMEKTLEPVVFLDVDLEFHQFPELFLDDSWPDGPRDVALFNFWANETNITYRHTPNIGSAVAYFNQTYRAKHLLTAWAEAMQYSTNSRAPDDQALDKPSPSPSPSPNLNQARSRVPARPCTRAPSLYLTRISPDLPHISPISRPCARAR